MTVSLIAAQAKNRAIGKDGAIPWHIPEDLKRFKRLTMGKPIIMGRKTYESIGRALPGRSNIVVTRNPNFEAEGVTVTHSLLEATDFARTLNSEEFFVIGGQQLYAAALPDADRLYLTYVDIEVEGDTFFPEFDQDDWLELEREPRRSEKSGLAFSFVTYARNVA